MKKKICLDTSIIIDKKVPEIIEKEKVKEVIIPYAALDELQAQASKGREEGFIGLEELKRIREVCKKKGVQIKFAGQRPTLEDIKLARSGRIDAIIRDVAKTEKATLVTADYVQALVAEAEGVDVLYIPADIKTVNLTFEQFFDNKTMSVHLKEGVPPYAKRGKPGKFKLVKLRDKPLTKEEIESIIKEIVEAARVDEKSSFEIIRNHAMVIQFQNYRIAIARPPFSDGLEVTIVKPIAKLRLEDYKLSERLLKRLKEKAEGILVCGPPGSGKCLPKGTKVLLPDGTFKNIEELKSGDYVLSIGLNEFVENPIIKTYKRKESKLIKIKTKLGRDLILTEEHPILCIKDGFVEWREAKNLDVGDVIGVAKKIDIEGKEIELNVIDLIKNIEEGNRFYAILDDGKEKPINEVDKTDKVKYLYYKGDNHIKSRKIKVNIKIDEKFAELLGLLWAEGSEGNIEFNNCDDKLIEHYKNLMMKIFDVKEDEFYFAGRGRLRIRNPKTIYLVLKALGYPDNKKSKTLKVPEIILKSSKKVISAFIRGVFEGDGYVGERGIEIVTASREFANGIYYLLVRLGIISFLKEKNVGDSTYYRVLIQNSEDITKFYNIVKPKVKIAEFKKFLNKENNPNVGTVPVGNILKELYELFGESLDNANKNEYSMKRLERHLNILIEKYKDYVAYKEKIENLRNINSTLKDWRRIIKKLDNLLKSVNKQKFCEEHHIDHNAFSEYLSGNRRPTLKTIIKYLEEFNKEFNLENTLMHWKNIDKQLNEIINAIKNTPFIKFKPETLGKETKRLLMKEKKLPNLISLSEYIDEICREYYERLDKIELYLSNLVAILDKNIFWDKIIEKTEIEYNDFVYDIEVPYHNFIINETPVIVHNSTFVSALVEFYLKQGKIIKTLESPRDLQVPDEVTQYTPLEGSFEKTADILLLVRPDYTAFDEVRKTQDFEIFVDMRLAGVGMIGVVHASKAIDAVQRFLSRVELGMLPHIVDTVIFIKNGGVDKVYTLEITVKVPSGMTEEDLSRPVVEVRDFETGKLEYEIYTYGEENVVVPVKEEKPSGIRELARQRIYQVIRKFDKNAEVEIVSDHKAIIRVDNKKIPRIIGREGSVIKKLEEMLGISLEVEPRVPTLGNEVEFKIDETGNSIEFKFKKNIVGKLVSFYVDDKFIFSATVGKKNKIKVSKNSELGRKILKIMASGKKIKAFI